MRCDGRPDPTKAREVNTFLSLLNENGSHELQAALDDVKLLLSVSSFLVPRKDILNKCNCP